MSEAGRRPPAEPGDRRPGDAGAPPPRASRLARPPSERYAAGAAHETPPRGPAPSNGRSPAFVVGPASAFGAAILTAAALVIVGGILAERTGLLAISGIGGAAIGLLCAGAAVPRNGVVPAVMSRDRAVRSAVVLAFVAVAGGAIGTWVYGRLEGGVLDPLTYLWTVFGPFIPAEIVIAVGAAAWGATAGPVRGRS